MAEPKARPKIQNHSFHKYPTQGFNEFEAPDVTAWKLARAAIEHENNLVNHRVTWLMTSQAYLFTAFSILLAGLERKELETVRPLIPYFMVGTGLLAIYICLVIQDALYRAFYALDHLTTHYYKLVVSNNWHISNADNQGVPLTRTPPLHFWTPYLNILNQFSLPMAMIFVWLILLVSFGLYSIPVTKELISTLGVREVLEILGVFIIFVLLILIYAKNKYKTKKSD